MIRRIFKWLLIPALVLGLYFFSTGRWIDKKDPGPSVKGTWAAPVETAAIERGFMTLRYFFCTGLVILCLIFSWLFSGCMLSGFQRTDTAALKQYMPPEIERFNVGAGTALLVAQARRDLLISQIAEVRAVIHCRIALIRLFLAEGSLLARRGIVFTGINKEDFL